jgi:hypothetical protein
MDVEVVDDDEFALIEAACLQAEQNINHSSVENKPKRPRFLPSSLAPAPPAPPLPFLIYRGKTTYCREDVEIDRAAAFLLAINLDVVGFDVEWKITYETGKPPRPIALIQLCMLDPSLYTPDGSPPYHCFLLHVNRNSRNTNGGAAPALTPKLVELLASETVRKAGVGIHGDSLKLERDYGIKMKGLIDLSEVANSRLCSSCPVPPPTAVAAGEALEGAAVAAAAPVQTQVPQKWSMAALAEKLMHKTVRKSQNIRCSDWEQDPLTAEQQIYAATDAWVSLRLYEILSSMPITWQPAAVPTAAPAPSGRIEAAAVALTVNLNTECIPACKAPAALQPAKLAVLQQHYQGIDVAEIAALRQIKPSTVQSYLAEAIIAGHAYNWERLSVKNEIMSIAAAAAMEAGVAFNSVKGDEYTPRDVLNELLEARNIKIRALFEEIEGKISGLGFGDLRLAFAHLGRTQEFKLN